MGIQNKADRLGIKHLGVDRQEYGDTIGYRFHTALSIASEAVRRAFGLDSHISQTNVDKSLEADLERGDKR